MTLMAMSVVVAKHCSSAAVTLVTTSGVLSVIVDVVSRHGNDTDLFSADV